MPFALVQHTSATTASATQAKAFNSGVTAGNLMVVGAADFSTTATITSIGDTLGSVWHQAVLFTNTAGASRMVIYWALAPSSGANTVTIVFGSSGNNGEIWISEWSGADATVIQDGIGVGSTGTLATINAPAITTTLSNGIVFNYVDSANAQTVHSPWLALESVSGDNAQYQVNVPPGIYTPSNTQTSGTYGSVTVAIGSPTRSFMPGRMPLGC